MEKSRKYYRKLVKSNTDAKLIIKNFFQAFFFGGLLCFIGQIILEILNGYFEFKISSMLLSIIMVIFSAIFTGIGIYDNIGQIAKCGIAIPITGFANACVSSAIEYRKEGLVLGVGSNCLKLAGSVIVLGTCSAIIVNLIRYVFEVLL